MDCTCQIKYLFYQTTPKLHHLQPSIILFPLPLSSFPLQSLSKTRKGYFLQNQHRFQRSRRCAAIRLRWISGLREMSSCSKLTKMDNYLRNSGLMNWILIFCTIGEGCRWKLQSRYCWIRKELESYLNLLAPQLVHSFWICTSIKISQKTVNACFVDCDVNDLDFMG